MKLWQAAFLGACVLAAGCASNTSDKPAPSSKVQQGVGANGAKTVTSLPEKVACDTDPRCPVLSAAWSSAKAGQATLTVGMPGQQAEITSVEFHFSGMDAVRLSLPARNQPPAPGYPATVFDVPLRVLSQIAYGQRSWLRASLSNGRTVDQTLDDGDTRGKALDVMTDFLTAVDAAGGSTGAKQQRKGGLLDIFGGDGDQ